MTDQTPSSGADARPETGTHTRLPDEQSAGPTDTQWRERAAGGSGEIRVERAPEGAAPERTMHLLRQLVGDAAVLVQKELALAASEISHSVADVKRSVGSMVTGGAVLYAGLLFLLVAAMLGLALVVPGWAAALIVGAVVALIGLIMLQSGKSKFEPSSFASSRTAESIRKDRDAIRRHT